MKRAISALYNEYLPNHSHPFVYLSLQIFPSHVDVNVHPTKREVHFLNEEQVIDEIRDAFEKSLQGANSSRAFLMQTTLDMGTDQKPKEADPKKSSGKSGKSEEKPNASRKRSQPPANKMVRTDSHNPSGRLAAYLRNPTQNVLANKKRHKRQRTKLTSVRELYSEHLEKCSASLEQVFSDCTFVGCVDEKYALLQHKTKMYLVNVPALCKDLMLERVLLNFGHLKKYKLSTPAPIEKLLLLALKYESTKGGETKEKIAQQLTELLISKGEMLEEYFAVKITDSGHLTELPVIMFLQLVIFQVFYYG
eukprot:CAMPEP_0167769274 /NCGR_PEP_ID=MMETSP0110_2-20121227/17208_1 /TAXON_ID=629695 /ORGANISM="Gymnochlora sp., Strain CCMP2014" /LENGTH=306 /DNA_ID=CAMNT_0007658193 /DNA_START=350 /DNA_END=1270 /DNA_ORIENTATION=-